MMKKPNHQYRFTNTHEWIDTSAQPMAVGITEHAQNLLGDIVFIEVPKINTKVQAGQTLGVLESVKAAADYYAPVSGVISAINPDIENNPALINQDPFGAGWICKIEPEEQQAAKELLDEQTYQNKAQS
jgi:glycine cleavage system H protein